MFKAYLSAHLSSLSAFMISKTHIVFQKPHGRQLSMEVCGSESAIFVTLSFFVMTNEKSKTVQVLTQFYHKTDAECEAL